MFFGVYLAAGGSCIYIRTRGGIVSRPQSQTDSVSNSYTYRTRNQKKLVCQDIKIKQQKEVALLQGNGPDFGGPFTRMSHVRAASPRLATAWPGQARRGEASERAHVVFPFSSHTSLRVVERTHYIKRSNSSSTSKVGLNLAPPLAILHMGFEISEIAMGLAH